MAPDGWRQWFVLDTITVSPGLATCTVCGGTLSWHEERQLSVVVEAMTDHVLVSHPSATSPTT